MLRESDGIQTWYRPEPGLYSLSMVVHNTNPRSAADAVTACTGVGTHSFKLVGDIHQPRKR